MTEAIKESPDQTSAATATQALVQPKAEQKPKNKGGRPKKIQTATEPQRPPMTQPPAPVALNVTVADSTTGHQKPSSVINKETQFFRGQWANKSNPNDPDSVTLAINGETIRWQRGVDVIVPAPYLANAKDARYPKYKQEPGMGRKVEAYITRFPFTPSGTATLEEFRRAFMEGTKATQKAVQQYGLKVPVAESVPQLE